MIVLLLKVTALCLGALIAMLAMRRASAALRHLVAAAAVVGILLLPISLLTPAQAAIPMPGVRFAISVASGISKGGRPAMVWVLAAWGVGAVLFLARLAIGYWRIHSLVRRAEPVGEAFLTDVPVPLAAGLVSPVILLPRSFPSWPLSQQSAVLRHEQAHIERRDLWVNLGANVACALYWYHPLVWALSRELRREQETACDDAVLTGGMPPASYAEALTAAARQFTSTSLPGCPMQTHQTLKHRIARLFDSELPRKAGASSIRRTAVIAVAVLALLGAVQAQQDKGKEDGTARHEKVYKAGEGGVVAPRLLIHIEPAYTDEARAAKIEGTVELTVVIDVDGTAGEVTVVRTPDAGLGESAVEAVKRWGFQPGTLNGEPVPVTATIEVNFRLQ